MPAHILRLLFVLILLLQVCALQSIPVMFFTFNNPAWVKGLYKLFIHFDIPILVWQSYVKFLFLTIGGTEIFRSIYNYLLSRIEQNAPDRFAVKLFPFAISGVIVLVVSVISGPGSSIYEIIFLIIVFSVAIYALLLIGLFFQWLFNTNVFNRLILSPMRILIINVLLAGILYFISRITTVPWAALLVLSLYSITIILIDYYIIHRFIPLDATIRSSGTWGGSLLKSIVAGVFVFFTVVASTTYLSKPHANYYAVPFEAHKGKILIFETWDHKSDYYPIKYFFGVDEYLIKSHNKWNGRSYVYDINDRSLKEMLWSITQNEVLLDPPLYLPSCELLITIPTGYGQWKYNVYDINGKLKYTFNSGLDVPALIPGNDCKVYLFGEKRQADPFVNVIWDVGRNKSTEPENLNKYRMWMLHRQKRNTNINNGFIFKASPKISSVAMGLYSYNEKDDTVRELYTATGGGIFYHVTSDHKNVGLQLYSNAFPKDYTPKDGNYLVRLISIEDKSIIHQFERNGLCLFFSLQPETDSFMCANSISNHKRPSIDYAEKPDLAFLFYDWDGKIKNKIKQSNSGHIDSIEWIDRNHFIAVITTKSNRDLQSLYEQHDSLIVNVQNGKVEKASEIIMKKQ